MPFLPNLRGPLVSSFGNGTMNFKKEIQHVERAIA